MTKVRTKYPKETIKQALELYHHEGLAVASKTTKVPKATINAWARKAGVEMKYANQQTAAAIERNTIAGTNRRAEVSKLAIAGSHKALKLIVSRLEVEGHEMPIKDLGTIFGILVDKHRALSSDGAGAHSAVDDWLTHMGVGSSSAVDPVLKIDSIEGGK